MSFKNILLIQTGDIGDVVLTTPSIRAIRENYPNARISILVRKSFGSLLMADPNLYEVEEFERVRGSFVRILQEYIGLARRLRRNRYDLVIDLRTGDRGQSWLFLRKRHTGSAAEIRIPSLGSVFVFRRSFGTFRPDQLLFRELIRLYDSCVPSA